MPEKLFLRRTPQYLLLPLCSKGLLQLPLRYLDHTHLKISVFLKQPAYKNNIPHHIRAADQIVIL